MKINVTKKEYRTLMELLFLGDWVLHAHSVEDRPETAAHRALFDKIKSYYKDFHCEDLVFPSDDNTAYFESREFEDTMLKYVEDYDDQSFWSELPSRLAVRDAFDGISEHQRQVMTAEERVGLIWDAEQPWADELEQHGLNRIGVVGKE